jgi:predicted TIM-barrel fold metal-dependent hydrolase
MVSRREVLVGGLVTAVSGMFSQNAPQPGSQVSFYIPPGGCDCHVHVFGDPKRYPFWDGRSYTPEPATVEELRGLLQALHLDRVVVVQPSVYGTDNSCTLDSIRTLGKRARAVVVIDHKTSEASLDEMHRAGVRGIRLNFSTLGITDPAAARQRLLAGVLRVKNPNWHIQINTQPGTIEALHEELKALPVTLVIDHFGGMTAARGIEQPGFGTLVSLVKAGKAYVKISAAADSVSTRPDLSDVAPFARALVAANPRQILWGTNWPHPGSAAIAGRKPTDLAPHVPTDDGKVLNMLPVWVPDAATRRMILVENPARLYGF